MYGVLPLKSRGQSSAIEVALIVPVIIAAIIIFVFLVPNYSYSAGSEVDTFQLNAMAQSLLQYIVTNPGNPPNWGLNSSGLSSFGLAEPNQPYHLDPFKVMALVYWDYANGFIPRGELSGYCTLNQINGTGFRRYLSQLGVTALSITGNWLFTPGAYAPWIINYTEVKELLGLGSDYEFRLVLTPVMNISVVGFPPTGPGNFNLVIRVLNSVDNTPISGAEVGIQYFAIDQAGNDLACQYGLVTPCTPAPSNAQLPPASTFTILSTKPLIIEGSEVGYTNRSGYVVFTLPLSYDGDNSYFIIIRASLAGLGDYYYFQYPTQSTPLLMVGVLPMGTTYNSIVFTDPHLFTDCLINSGLVANPSATSLGLRVIAVYRSLYGYVFEGLNFTLNPGRGSHSYPIPCSSLAASNASDYSACYWNLPSEPMLLIVNVVRNSQGQAGAVPLAQSIIVPYGLYPNYLMNNGPIVFGESIRDAPVGTATALVYIGDSTYYATLYLYYGGNAFEPMGQQ